jgi:hypothetical protein
MKEGIVLVVFAAVWMLLGFLGFFAARASGTEAASPEEIQDLLATP